MIVIESSAMVDALLGAVNPELLDLLATEDLHSPALLDFEARCAATRWPARSANPAWMRC